MELIFVEEYDFLIDERAQSPEDFLSCLEEALEAGELTIDEVAQLIHDFVQRS